MSSHFAGWDSSTLDLAIERYTVGLGEDDQAALDRAARERDLADFEAVISDVHLANLGELEAPSPQFMSVLEREGRALVESGATRPPVALESARPTSPGWFALSGWLLAAAALLFILIPSQPAELGTRRAHLIARAGDLLQLEWSPTGDEAGASASGEVVWSSAEQEGYMRFVGLEPNDPGERQYQLWIFDSTRADWEARPVDGGVFDVDASGEVIVAIDPKLEVRESVLFAVTLEVPGGVVVSDRERLVLTAAL